MMKRKLKGGMIGGAIGAFIGPVHRMAAIMDGEAEFVAGAFSRNPERSSQTGEALYIDPTRAYSSWQTMLAEESARPANDRLDFVSIVSVTASHFEIAKAFAEAGFNVICDKPMTITLEQAVELRNAVTQSGVIFALTHNYTGYPMVKQARHIVSNGELGELKKVMVEYHQGWLSNQMGNQGSGIDLWRMDPKEAGSSCCTADIGIHAENLCRYITGLEIESLCAETSSFIENNPLEDDVLAITHFTGGTKGSFSISQILTGEENGLTIRIYGTKKSLEWKQEDPNYLIIKDPSGFHTRLSKGNPDILCPAAMNAGRLPFGHPDGFIEAFANVYLAAFEAIREKANGQLKASYDFPSLEDGVIGLQFIETIIESGKSDSKWTKMIIP